MHILLLDPFPFFDFAHPELRPEHRPKHSLGHQVTTIRLAGFETPLGDILATLNSPPDCIVQMETLGKRHFVSGLEKAPCPTVFFSFDTHLNLFWQRHYAKLFDATATPHVSWFENLPKEDSVNRVFRLPHVGNIRPWRPHGARQHPLGFCGRRTIERPLRAWMLDLLEQETPIVIRDGIPFDDMMEFYGDTRAVSNEAICFEVNCRLFEAASAGAVPLTPDCGPDQEAVFALGAEMLVYKGGLDLLDKARWLAANPEKAERIGRAAWERVQREHLPVHRAKTLLETLPGLSQARATGNDAALRLWLAYVERMKTGDMGYPLSHLLSQSETLPETAEMLAGLLNLLALPARREEALAVCRALLEQNLFPSSGICNATASAAALLHGDFPLARQFWLRFCEHTPELPSAASDNAVHDTPFSLCLAWAENEKREGRSVRPGFSFSSAKALLPACAFEFLTFAEEMGTRKKNNASASATDAKLTLLENFPPYIPYRLRLLQERKAREPHWESLLEASALSLRCCLVAQGAGLLAEAAESAAAANEEQAFRAALAASPAREYSLRNN